MALRSFSESASQLLIYIYVKLAGRWAEGSFRTDATDYVGPIFSLVG